MISYRKINIFFIWSRPKKCANLRLLNFSDVYLHILKSGSVKYICRIIKFDINGLCTYLLYAAKKIGANNKMEINSYLLASVEFLLCDFVHR